MTGWEIVALIVFGAGYTTLLVDWLNRQPPSSSVDLDGRHRRWAHRHDQPYDQERHP